MVLTTAVLLALASPLIGVQLRNSTTAIIPPDSDQREFVTVIEEEYPALQPPPVRVVVEAGSAEALAADISELDSVTAVDPPTPVGEDYAVLGVRLDTDDPGGEVATDVVRDIRELRDSDESLGEYWVVGQAAAQLDFVDSMAEGAPYAAAFVVVAIFVLLFLMTGSLLVPVKALVINLLSLAAGLGVLGVGVRRRTPGGPARLHLDRRASRRTSSRWSLAFGFGLAMDYEVFLLARIKELYDAGEDNDDVGPQRACSAPAGSSPRRRC